MLSAVNCSHVDSWSRERVTALTLRCHGDGDVIAVTSLCAGFLSRDCGCCPDELQDCRVPVVRTDPTLMSLRASCQARRSCKVLLYQPDVTHCLADTDVTAASDYVIVFYRCISAPPISAGMMLAQCTCWLTWIRIITLLTHSAHFSYGETALLVNLCVKVDMWDTG